MRAYNFSAGPSMLPLPVLEQIQRECLNWHDGMSVMEVSHRSSAFSELVDEIEQRLRRLMAIPENYRILFMQGGASSQFEMVPLNLLAANPTADYFCTGAWSEKAIKAAKKYAKVNIVTSSGPEFLSVAAQEEWEFTPGASYCHYTPNETIHGIEFPVVPDVSTDLVGDFSSSILSKPIDVEKHALIYAGAQKNMGPAGLCTVIIRDDLVGNASAHCPQMFDYAHQLKSQSMANTPPTFIWYAIGLVLEWLESEGGVAMMAEQNALKASELYQFIDTSDFYINRVAKPYRSRMNVPFQIKAPELEAKFLSLAAERGLTNLGGHRSVGGFRASIYNAMPLEGVRALIEFMTDFERDCA